MTWIVCEQEARWRRTLSRFAPPGSDEARRFDVRTASVGQARALAHQRSPLIVLWEIPPEAPQETIEAIAICHRLAARPLQIVSWSPRLRLRAEDQPRLILSLRRTGADLVLRNPEQMPLAMRMAARFAARSLRAMGGDPSADLDNRADSPTV